MDHFTYGVKITTHALPVGTQTDQTQLSQLLSATLCSQGKKQQSIKKGENTRRVNEGWPERHGVLECQLHL